MVAIRPRLLWFGAVVSATFAANIIAVYVMAHDKRGAPFFSRHDPWMTLAAFVNVAVLVWLLSYGLRAISSDDHRANSLAMRVRRQIAKRG